MGCTETSLPVPDCNELPENSVAVKPVTTVNGTWEYFLQHLPVKHGAVVDYRGKPIPEQSKHAAIVDYDIGRRDLQQCADAIIRLRAEYLFAQGKQDSIGFHFTSGHYYSWNDYCTGRRPVINGNAVRFVNNTQRCEKTHGALRKYLDIVYTYAGTISLCKELKETDTLGIGTVIITPGSPGHCSIIVDEGTTGTGEKVYKLAEGYTPAQSIYILRNHHDSRLSPWYALKDTVIETPSYTYRNYKLGSFE
jgi:hypothetical protein